MAKSTPLTVQAPRVLRVLLVQLAHKVPLVKMALPVLWDLLVPLVRMGHKVQLELLALLVRMERKVPLVQSDPKALLG